MRIAVELLGLIPGKIGGMETYARNLVRGLLAADTGNEYRLFVGSEARGTIPINGRASEFVADARMPGPLRRVRIVQSLWQWVATTNELRRWRYDLLHCTLNLPRPAWGAQRMVLTLPDLNFEDLPELWGPIRSRVLKTHARMGARRAVAILTLSEFARRSIVERYHIPEERVFVSNCGVDHDRFHPVTADEWKQSSKLDLPERYVFCPANTWPHKNHPRLVQALAILRDRHRVRIPLLLSGAEKHGHAALEQAIAQHGLADQVRWLGYVSGDDLVRCYQRATAVVFPSLYEGFGIPVVEAMACGCPVACSNTAATGEVAGSAAETFDPTNPEAIATAVGRVIDDPTRRVELAEAGLARAREFTWERTATQTLAAYRAVW